MNMHVHPNIFQVAPPNWHGIWKAPEWLMNFVLTIHTRREIQIMQGIEISWKGREL